MLNDTVQPALSAEEWEKAHGDLNVDAGGNIFWGDSVFCIDDDRRAIDLLDRSGEFSRRHAVAALALHGQPFGFTHRDLEALSRCADDAERWAAQHGWGDPGDAGYKAMKHVRTIRERIAALLPPHAAS